MSESHWIDGHGLSRSRLESVLQDTKPLKVNLFRNYYVERADRLRIGVRQVVAMTTRLKRFEYHSRSALQALCSHGVVVHAISRAWAKPPAWLAELEKEGLLVYDEDPVRERNRRQRRRR